MENYHVLEVIGEGSFGKVYKGRKKYSAQVVALKFIPKVGKPEKELRNLRREIDIMRNLHHENIIEMLDSFETDKEVVVVTDYAEGELFQILEDDGNLPEEQVRLIACQLVSALYYLHSHRILHRDMKPQNILLGKGGIVKLCDFGFARAMSFNTLVLTSIKGTPLYMSPELVEEKPYDHTADLWALGCILYELFTGTPPFYTNSIFQLVSLIIKDPVKWPKNMTPAFKDFLQGLLTKNPRCRLAWPELLNHPFVSDGVNVREEDTLLQSPFTQPLTASMMLMKEKQAKEKAHPPGTSKILAKARKKAMEEEKKEIDVSVTREKGKEDTTANAKEDYGKEAWGPTIRKQETKLDVKPLPEPVEPTRVNSPSQEPWDDTGVSKQTDARLENISPTPRADRISVDYEKEYPSIEIEGRRTVRKSPSKKEKKHVDNVKLETEEVDSDDEWQGLIDQTDQDGDPDTALKLLQDVKFHNKLKTRVQTASGQVLDCMLEGAARLKTVYRVITNLVTLKCELQFILDFVKTLSLPKQPLNLLAEILDKHKVKQQPWCQQILIDLVIALNAYFASEISWNDGIEKDVVNEYYEAMIQFMSLLPQLVFQPMDDDKRLREQAILCAMYTCEAMERNKLKLANQYFTCLASKQTTAIDALLDCSVADPNTLQKMTELADDNGEMASERLEGLINISVTTLAAMVNLPLSVEEGADGRRKMQRYAFRFFGHKSSITDGPDDGHRKCLKSKAKIQFKNKISKIALYIGDRLATKGCEQLTDELLLLLRHSGHCSNILKVVYACSQVSQTFCSYLSNSTKHMESLLGILMGKVDIADMEINSVIETVIHVFSTMTIQLQTLSPALTDAAGLMISIFLESTIASHTAAAALLFSQMIYCGMTVEVQPEEMLQACLAVFTDLQQICVRCPFDYGVLDGLLLLLCEMLAQSEGPVAQLYIETGIWGTLWHRVAQALQVTNPDTNSPIHDIEMDVEEIHGFHPPDWTLVSPQGLMAVLQMAVTVFTKETNQCIPNLSVPDSIILLTIIHLLHREFLHVMYKGFNGDGPQLTVDMILEVTQLCCFPFAVDIQDDLLQEVQQCLYDTGLLPRLMFACTKYLTTENLETPIGLIARLVLSSHMFVEQFALTIGDLKAISFLADNIHPSIPMAIVCDVISICGHLIRLEPDNLVAVKSVFSGNKGDFEPLVNLIYHHSAAIKSRTCSLIGNLLKHNNHFYNTLKQREKILSGLIACLKDDDPNVRKSASYAIGNAVYHGPELYMKLKPTVPILVELLTDPIAKTRSNVASACSNLAIHSNTMCPELKKAKLIPRLLDLACHEQQQGVQISAILALRTLAKQEELRKEMMSNKGIEKLTTLSIAQTPRASSVNSRSSMALVMGSHSIHSSNASGSNAVYSHCCKLLQALQGRS